MKLTISALLLLVSTFVFSAEKTVKRDLGTGYEKDIYTCHMGCSRFDKGIYESCKNEDINSFNYITPPPYYDGESEYANKVSNPRKINVSEELWYDEPLECDAANYYADVELDVSCEETFTYPDNSILKLVAKTPCHDLELPYDENNCGNPIYHDACGHCYVSYENKPGNKDFPELADNEKILFYWQVPQDRSTECQSLEGKPQNAVIDCQEKFRCVKEVETCPRDEHISSYVSPVSGTFHEDIALTGSNIQLHYQSNNLKNETIAAGWSLGVHHTLKGDYLYSGNGKVLNVKAYKKTENNTTVVTLDELKYIFGQEGRHLFTKESFTDKILYSFHYDNHKLISIKDSFENETVIVRDSEGKYISIITPYGQTTFLNINENNDLLSITYEDNSSYTFGYENHLMVSEKEPNGNEFLHIFDLKGKVVRVVDAEQANWEFSRYTGKSEMETIVNRPDRDVKSYYDYTLNNDVLLSETVMPNGERYSQTESADGKQSVSKRCGVTKTITYKEQRDPVTKEKLPDTVTIKTPNGLTHTTTFSKNYTLDGNRVVKLQTTTETNGVITQSIRDYNASIATVTSPEGRVSTIEYDQNTLLPTKTAVANLKPVTYKYDSKGRVVKVQQGSRAVKYVYNKRGNLKKEINLQTKTTTSYRYDKKDRLTKIIYPDGSSVKFKYDKNGNRTVLRTPTPISHKFTYNGVNKKTSYTSPLGFKTQYIYDKQRRVTDIIRPSGKKITNQYQNGELVQINTSEDWFDYSYDCGGKVSFISKDMESISYQYDGDLLTNIQFSGTLYAEIGMAYDNKFQLKSLSYADQKENYSYDKDGLLTQSGEFNITRDAINGLAAKVTDGSFTLNRTYNRFGELKTQNNKRFKLKLTREDGRIAHKNEVIVYPANKKQNLEKQIVESQYDYVYDVNDRLIEVKKEGNTTESYTYDSNGNRMSATINGVTTTASCTLDDQLEVYGDNTYRYDDDGYLMEKTTPEGTTNYTYSTLGALTDVEMPDGTTIKYHQNALNQRVAKEVNGTITERYLWLNLTTLLATYDGEDNLVQRFEYADSRMPMAMTYKNKKYYLHYDQVGTLRAVTNHKSKIIKEIIYDTYGNILNDSNPTFKVPFGFAGGLYDSDTKLTRFGYRDYDAYTGKWTAKDPIGFAGGDTNLYGYVLGDPINFVDPTGEFAWFIPIFTVIGGLTVGVVNENINGGGMATVLESTVYVCGAVALGAASAPVWVPYVATGVGIGWSAVDAASSVAGSVNK